MHGPGGQQAARGVWRQDGAGWRLPKNRVRARPKRPSHHRPRRRLLSHRLRTRGRLRCRRRLRQAAACVRRGVWACAVQVGRRRRAAWLLDRQCCARARARAKAAVAAEAERRVAAGRRGRRRRRRQGCWGVAIGRRRGWGPSPNRQGQRRQCWEGPRRGARGRACGPRGRPAGRVGRRRASALRARRRGSERKRGHEVIGHDMTVPRLRWDSPPTHDITITCAQDYVCNPFLRWSVYCFCKPTRVHHRGCGIVGAHVAIDRSATVAMRLFLLVRGPSGPGGQPYRVLWPRAGVQTAAG